MTQYGHWTLDIENRVGTLSLNRAGHANSLTPKTFYELGEISAHLADRNDVWTVVLQGEGDHFSIGVDVEVIRQMPELEEGQFRETLLEMQTCVDSFETLPKPTIAKLHGFCLGGGLILALCCDFRIASTRTVFGLPEVKRGIPVLMGTHRLTRVAGPAVTKELILLAENFRAQRALELGIVHRVVEPEGLDVAVANLAAKFRKLPPRTVGMAKRIIDEGSYLSLHEGQNLEVEAQTTLLNSPDLLEAIDSFFENRAPEYVGE